ncbi:MAG: thiolase family protein, partial [bacterium]
MHEYGVTEEDIARYAVVMRKHAGLNPYAVFRKPITVEDVLASRVISPPIHLFECSTFLTGAACTILASEEAAKKMGADPVFLTGFGESHDPAHFIPHEPGLSITHFQAVTDAMEEALADAGISRDKIDVAEIYEVFAGPGLMLLEDLGFFEKGEAPAAVKKGAIDLDGQIPTNPSGGRICMGHPGAVTPQLMLMELVEQLKGEAGDRQVKNARTALVQAEHGVLNGAMIFILGT